ncbi:hypothetical protein BABA_23455 [Neobacillus bataviensis LMG 21833]|uniref:Glycolate oxidase iron-sulfur subunit n=1 Tax=Neobacillus bataviensis LMG 21833 TaxID=1117379 RepID=K6D843_9BACI|nr:(Fe-S)-binding protein [Neobacillus bataviensis]EKN64258.1 hypothetical protein BABA_23455 [Neobacillus bataviensis LMG 21833]
MEKLLSNIQEDNKYATKLYDLSYEAANMCIQCGYCLPVCPTFQTMGKESHSPRGRINLVKVAAEGKIDVRTDLATSIDLCLGCRACEVVCPVNVPYGKIYESAKEVMAIQQLDERIASGKKGYPIQNVVLRHLFPHKKRLRLVGNAIWLYQKTQINKLVQKMEVMNKLSEPMGQFEKKLPKIESPLKRYKFGKIYPAKGTKKMKVAFFPGCIMDAVMSRTNRLTIELLQYVGCEVVIPKQQNCCGALHAHQGMMNEARELARANIESFEATGAVYFINNAGGCGAMLREYNELYKDDAEMLKRASTFVMRSRDISEVLVELGPLPFKKEVNKMVTYQDSCHLRNVQGVRSEPRELLRSIPGINFVEMQGGGDCCGSGGIYNLLHFDESMEILDHKMKNVTETKAKVIVTSNPGCLLQMKMGVERSHLAKDTDVLHLVEILAEACAIQ